MTRYRFKCKKRKNKFPESDLSYQKKLRPHENSEGWWSASHSWFFSFHFFLSHILILRIVNFEDEVKGNKKEIIKGLNKLCWKFKKILCRHFIEKLVDVMKKWNFADFPFYILRSIWKVWFFFIRTNCERIFRISKQSQISSDFGMRNKNKVWSFIRNFS